MPLEEKFRVWDDDEKFHVCFSQALLFDFKRMSYTKKCLACLNLHTASRTKYYFFNYFLGIEMNSSLSETILEIPRRYNERMYLSQ